MASVFDSSDSEEDQPASCTHIITVHNKSGPFFNSILASTVSFLRKYEKQTLDDLRNGLASNHLDSLDDKLDSIISQILKGFYGLVKDKNSGDIDHSTAENLANVSKSVSMKLFDALVSSKKWPHQSWCECFIFCNLIASSCFLANGKDREAIQCADYAFILGAPKEVTNVLFRLVDPRLNNDNDDRSCNSQGNWLWGLQQFEKVLPKKESEVISMV